MRPVDTSTSSLTVDDSQGGLSLIGAGVISSSGEAVPVTGTVRTPSRPNAATRRTACSRVCLCLCLCLFMTVPSIPGCARWSMNYWLIVERRGDRRRSCEELRESRLVERECRSFCCAQLELREPRGDLARSEGR